MWLEPIQDNTYYNRNGFVKASGKANNAALCRTA
jgi:hypothetical protein